MKNVIVLLQLFVFTLFGLEAVQAAALLEVVVNPNPASPRDTLSVGMTVSNSGDTPLSDVEVHLSYPQGLQAFDTHYIALGSSLQGVNCGAIVSSTCSAGEIVIWTVGDLEPGVGTSLQMFPTVAADVPDGTLIQFEAELVVGEVVLQKNRTIMIQESSPLKLRIDELVNPVGEEGYMVYSLSYSNLGATTSDTQLTFSVPENTSFVAASDGALLSDDTVTWDLDSLVSNTGGERQVQLSVDGLDGALVYLDSLQLTGLDSTHIEQETEATRVTKINSVDTPEFALSINPDPASSGDTLSVGMTVSNSGDTALSDVEVHLRYPEGLQPSDTHYISLGSSLQGVNCGAIVSSTCSAGEIVVWDVGLLMPGVGTSLQMLPAVADVAGGTLIQFEAEVWVDGVQVVQKSRTIMTQEFSPLELSVDESVNPVGEETDMIYSLSYSNLGATTSGTQLSFSVPENTSFVAASEGGTYEDDTVTWDLGSLLSNTGGERQVQLSVDGVDGELVYLDSLQLSGLDSTHIEQEAEATRITKISSVDRPEFALSINPDPASPGNTLTVGLTVSNSGDIPLSNVEVHLRYPEGLQASATHYMALGSSLQSVNCGAIVSSTCSAGEIVVWDVGLLMPGDGTSLQMLPAVADVAGGTLIQFEAEVWVDHVQVSKKSQTIIAQESPPLGLSIDDSVNPVSEDADMIYSLNYSNLGATTSGTQLSLVVPEGSCFISASDGGTFEVGKVTWNLNNLLSNAGGERQVRLSVDSDEGDLLVLDSLQLTGLDLNSIEQKTVATRITKINSTDTPDFILSTSPDPTVPGDNLTVGLTVSNSGAAALSNVEVHLRYPEGIQASYTHNISLGSSSQDVSCGAIVSSTCSAGEMVVWNVGRLDPEQVGTFEMTPAILNVEEGTQIQFEASVWVDGRQRVSKAETVFVGSMFDESGDTSVRADINNDGLVTLDDLILVLQNLAGYDVNLTEFGDCNCDGKLGLPEVMAILQELK